MPELLTVDRFEPLIGQPFRLDRAAPITLRLAAATRSGPRAPGFDREPFVLRFDGPQSPLLAQSIYRLAHDELGDLDIFLVPVARDAGGVHYEAVFG
jgi:hypothetical protein